MRLLRSRGLTGNRLHGAGTLQAENGPRADGVVSCIGARAGSDAQPAAGAVAGPSDAGAGANLASYADELAMYEG